MYFNINTVLGEQDMTGFFVNDADYPGGKLQDWIQVVLLFVHGNWK